MQLIGQEVSAIVKLISKQPRPMKKELLENDELTSNEKLIYNNLDALQEYIANHILSSDDRYDR